MSKPEKMGMRLRDIRKKYGLSLRDFADWLTDATGFETSYESIRQYEQGQRVVPSDYLSALTRACGVSSDWILRGECSVDPATVDQFHDATPATKILAEIGDINELATRTRVAWRAFMEGDTETLGPRSIVRESWERSKRNGVDPRQESPCVLRVSEEDLKARFAENKELIGVAKPHLRWISKLLGSTSHVAYLTDVDGVVLWSCSHDDSLIKKWELEAGFDWSEESMGTNGAGTALATGEVVAVIGTEHYIESIQDCVCVGAPIFDSEGAVCGAVDLSTTLAETDPQRIFTMAYVAAMIGQDFSRLRIGV